MQPRIYTPEQHSIDPQKIDTHAFYVIQKLRQSGHVAYLVGGGVRDLLLKRRPKDFDVSTSAKPEEIRSLFRNAILIGRRFRLAHIRFGKKVIEVSTFRAGDTESADLIVRDNVWGSEEQDVLRRDFTINGLFYNPESGEVIDYVDGYLDLGKKTLRAIGQPDARFIQDPVRMIRLIKFCARFNFEIDAPTFEALLNCKEEILKSSSARILEELFRMLESGSSKPFFHLLNEYGLLNALSPMLSEYLSNDPNNEAYKYLKEMDSEVHKSEDPLDRSLLLSGLVFPMFDQQLQEKMKAHGRIPHLGIVAEEANRIIDEIFQPFFKLPRRIRGQMAFLMTSQYRFIPLDGRSVRRPRMPRDPAAHLALHLLKWRSLIYPELIPAYTLWTEAAFATPPFPEQTEAPKRKRRRRRRRRPHE